MSECKDNQCTTTHQHNQEEECCISKAIMDSTCPVEQSVEMWAKSAPTAMKEVQVDILKEKIRKAWGSFMEKEADAFIEAMGSHWESRMKGAHANYNLRQDIKKVFEEACESKK